MRKEGINMEKNAMSVVTLPIKVTDKWQYDLLDKRFELSRKVYNNMLRYEIKQYNNMLHDKRYRESKKIIDSIYREHKEDLADAKKSKEFKEARKTCTELLKEYGFSSFSFCAKAIEFAHIYKEHISTACASRSIGMPMWAAFDKKLFGNGKKVHFKSYGDLKSIASDGRSGIRIVNEKGKTLKSGISDAPMYVLFGVNKGKILKLRVVIPKNDTYKMEMVERNIKVVRITRKRVRGKWKYFVQLTVEGLPALKYDKNTGEIKNTLGLGKVGGYINTTSITLISDKGEKKEINLNEISAIISQEEKRNEILKYMDASRRALNPDNYNPDGTIKNGIMKNGKRMRLAWRYSKGYKRALDALKDSYRVEAENRTLIRQRITNEILMYGNEFIFNDYPFEYAKTRKVVITENGDVEKHRKGGRNISKNAPSMVVSLLDQKVTTQGGTFKKIKLQEIDYTMESYREKCAERLLAS